MCGILNPKRVSKNLGRMWEDSSPVGMLKRNADRRNAVKDKNRMTDEDLTIQKEKRETYGRTRKPFDNTNTGLNIYK